MHADGVGIVSSYQGRYLGNSLFTPMWEELNRRKAVVYTHPLCPACAAQPELIDGQNRGVEFVFDTTRTIVSILANGVPARFPDIKFIWSHGGGTVPFSSVRSHLPHGVQLSQDGDALRLAGTVSYLGVTVPVSADATLEADGSGIAVTPTRISVASASNALSSVIAGQFRFVVPVTGLPLHLTIRSVSVVPGGVRVGASAADVAFTSHT